MNSQAIITVNRMLHSCLYDYQASVDVQVILEKMQGSLFEAISNDELENLLIMTVAQYIEIDPVYSKIAARLLRHRLVRTVSSSWQETVDAEMYRHAFIKGIHDGVDTMRFDARLLDFDLNFLAKQIVVERDNEFEYLGLKTLVDKYLKQYKTSFGTIYELPQSFWMRIAMGLALHELDKNNKAVEFYHLMSRLLFVPSTPTLLHAGMKHAQLSSCYLSYISDDLSHIFKCIGDNAQMSKWSGGVANDWTALRATGAMVQSIGISSQGTIPFMKVANDTTAAINRSGSRRGAVVAYMECWHYDFEDFLDLRRNTGDDRRRTHDMNTAAWIPDLFMKRIVSGETWTLFSPDEVSDLHELYGKAFEDRYLVYEKMAAQGQIRLFKTVLAKDLWRKHLTRLFETGHPWITYKDSCNVRSPQDHVGVIHSSNLCTEITLNTSKDETAVCNLGSLNLGRFVSNGVIDYISLAQATSTAVRMLDNVIDINFYPTKEGQVSNFRHRPIGLGMMGLQDAFYKLDVAFDSPEALNYSDELTENVAYYAILASVQLAKERGMYSSFKGSKWDRNILQFDTLNLLEQERGLPITRFGKFTKDWSIVREAIAKYGMRNSNTMAIAPTATIANISGCYPCIEPIYKNLYVKSNASGDFTVINSYLVEDLKKVGLWNRSMRDQLKYHDGVIAHIPSIPQSMKDKYKTAFDIDPFAMVRLTASRGKFIDQSQSHNIFMQGLSGKALSDLYMYAWQCGLKTTYYLRTLAASQIEKSTLDSAQYGFTQMRQYTASSSTDQVVVQEQLVVVTVQAAELSAEAKACNIENPDCESCQ